MKNVCGFILSIILICSSLSCSPPPQEADNVNTNEIRLPRLSQIMITLPKSLTEGNIMEGATGFSAVERLNSATAKHGTAEMLAKHLTNPVKSSLTQDNSVWELNPFLVGFDPLLEGEDGEQIDGAASQTSCPGNGPEEPISIKGFSGAAQGMCFARAIQLALKRLVSDYNTTITILNSQADFFNETLEGTVYEYTNTSAKTNSGTGLKVYLRYDCVANCEQLPLDRDYTYQMTFKPLNGETTIGRIDWTVASDGWINGTMTIDWAMMSPSASGGVPQIQYTFESDGSANVQNFSMKYADRNDQFFHDPTIVRLERRAENGDAPAMWIVQGQVNYLISIQDNPADGAGLFGDPFLSQAPVSMLFTAVAEDEFLNGRAMFNAILANGHGLANANQLPPNALQELHLWAAYKKMLAFHYTELFYHLRGLNKKNAVIASEWLPATEGSEGSRSRTKLPSWIGHDPENAPWIARDKDILTIDASADGRYIVTGATDGSLHIRNLGEGTDLLGCKPHGNDVSSDNLSAIHSVAISHDGTVILSVGTDGFIRMYNREDCLSYDNFNELHSVSVLETGCDSFDPYGMHKLKLNPNDNNEFFSISPGRDYATFRRWRIEGSVFTQIERKDVIHMSLIEETGATDTCMGANGIDLSFDGRYVVASFSDATARVWDLHQNSELVLRHPGQTSGRTSPSVHAVFTKDGQELYSGVHGSEAGLYRWPRRSLGLLEQYIDDSSFSKESDTPIRFLRTTHDYKRLLMIRGLDDPDRPRRWYGYRIHIMGMLENNNLTDILPTWLGPIIPGVYPIISHKFPRSIEAMLLPPESDILILPEVKGDWTKQHRVYSLDIELRLWAGDITNRPVPFIGHEAPVYRVSLSSDGKRLLTASVDGTANMYWTDTGSKILTLSGHGADPNATELTRHPNRVYSAYFADNNTKIITAGADHTARLWDIQGQQLETYRGHSGRVISAQANAAFTQIVTASEDGSIRIWDPQLPDAIHVVPDAHNGGWVNWATFSPDGTQIISGGTDRIVRFWDATLSPPQQIDSYTHTSQIAYVEMSRDSSRVAFGDYDGHATVINADDKSHVVTALHSACAPNDNCGSPNIYSASFSHDGHYLLLSAEDSYTGNENRGTLVMVYDINENSIRFGERVAKVWDSNLNVQDSQGFYGAAFHPTRRHLIYGGSLGGGPKFQPSWIDFDALWERHGWPDESDQVNPYFMEPAATLSPNVCFLQSTDELGQCGAECPCEQTCNQVPGGCTIYSPTSTFRHTNLGENSAIDASNYVHIHQLLESLSDSFYTDTFTPHPIPEIQR